MYWTEFLTIAVAHLFAVASPGPDFAVVLRQCVTYGTKAGLWTSIGVATGILLHVSYCILGVAFLLSQSPSLFNAMKFLAALYLLSVVIRQDTPTSVQIAYGIYLSIATFIWFAMMSKILGHAAVRIWFLRSGAWFERVMGAILILLALQIVFYGS